MATDSSQSHGQPSDRQTQQASKTDPIEFEQDPYEIAELGLTIDLPVDTVVRNERYGSSVSVSLTPPSIQGAIAVEARQVTNDDLTTEDVGDSIVEQLTNAGGRVLARVSDLMVADQRVDRFYVRMPRRSGESLPGDSGRGDSVRGYTVLQMEDGRFLTYELITREGYFAEARPVYEAIVASSRFADPADVALTRHTALTTGQRVIGGLTEPQFQRVVTANDDRWERLITPSASGADSDDIEHGYRRIRAWFGKRGEMAEGKSPGRFTAAERMDGTLVRIVARVLTNEQIIDSRSVLFLADDRDLEAWRVETLVRPRASSGGASARAAEIRLTEIGERDGDRVLVRVNSTIEEPTRIELTIPDLGYLSRVEETLLPQLIIEAGVPSDMAFYTYRSETQSISLRQDRVTRSRAASPVWTFKTRLDPNEPGWTSEYTNDGRFLSLTLPDDRVWTPVEPRRLVQLWQRKGLPVE